MPSDIQAVDCIIQPEIDPATCHATQAFLVEAIGAGRRPPALHVYSFRDEHAALGRFHMAPQDRSTDLHRRFAGGRVLPIGPGYAGVALILPRRDAMTDGPPGSLSAPQVMNRHVRGFLKGCRAAGIDPVYPGRDVVTVDKKIIGSVALETDRSGAAVFEMVIAVWRAFDDVPSLLDRADPDGVVSAAVLAATEVTDLERELERSIPFGEFAGMLCHGFGEQLGARVRQADLSVEDERRIEAVASDPKALGDWVYGRCRSDNLTHRGSWIAATGAFDVYFEDIDGVLGQVIVSGDLIANSDAVARLEAALHGCRREAAAIDGAISGAGAKAGDFLLGIGPLTELRDAILRGAPW